MERGVFVFETHGASSIEGSHGDDQVSVFGMPDFESPKADVLRKQEECKGKACKVSVRNHVIIVRTLAAKSATWLQELGHLAIPLKDYLSHLSSMCRVYNSNAPIIQEFQMSPLEL